MKETGKSMMRRLHQPAFATKYFVGDGLDIGSGDDSLGKYKSLFPLVKSVTDFDLPHGDAQDLARHRENTFDFVHSSHCLEHMHDPFVALKNWIRVLRPGGYAVILVPDEDLYEQGVFPSTWNHDHKWTFTVHKEKGKSWSPKSVSVTELLAFVDDVCVPIKVELLHGTFVDGVGRLDQTFHGIAESAIEIILRKNK